MTDDTPSSDNAQLSELTAKHDFNDRIRRLEHQCSAILFLSAFNALVNVVTILVAVLAVMG
jgi:hypothetical protein